ncbi:MAG: hypothetical protein KDA83_14710 [Planctomycetales bacterium]|nr:hypothetical protein [Planctomycetales bacterium]
MTDATWPSVVRYPAILPWMLALAFASVPLSNAKLLRAQELPPVPIESPPTNAWGLSPAPQDEPEALPFSTPLPSVSPDASGVIDVNPFTNVGSQDTGTIRDTAPPVDDSLSRPLLIESFEATPDPPLDPRTLEAMTEWGGPDALSIESPFFYRRKETTWRFLARGQAGFGDTTWETLPYLNLQRHGGLALGAAVRFLDGPLAPNHHPRMYDLTAMYQHRATLLNGWSFDVAAGVGAFSDFEGSAVEGIRFPGHAVLSGPLSERARWIAGIDYLDRDDFAYLPVAGIRWEPFPDLQVRAEFPRPMIRWITDQKAYYFRAELGGGTWAIEPAGSGDDVMTYREISVLFGIENRESNKGSGTEIGYVSGRRIDYRSGRASLELPDAWVFRIVDRF